MRGIRAWTWIVLGLLAIIPWTTMALAQFKLPFAKSQPKIGWLGDPQVAVAQARKLDRPLLVYVTAGYCGACRKMERETWSNTKVIDKINANFVALKLDAEKHSELASQLEVVALPTVLVFCQDGKRLDSLEGFQSTDELLKVLAKKDRPIAQVTPKK